MSFSEKEIRANFPQLLIIENFAWTDYGDHAEISRDAALNLLNADKISFVVKACRNSAPELPGYYSFVFGENLIGYSKDPVSALRSIKYQA